MKNWQVLAKTVYYPSLFKKRDIRSLDHGLNDITGSLPKVDQELTKSLNLYLFTALGADKWNNISFLFVHSIICAT